MRKKNINKVITPDEIKVGDKITISREVTVAKVRPSNFGRLGKGVVVTTDQGVDSQTVSVTDFETATLLERDESLDLKGAKVVTWKTDDDEQFFAIKIEDEDGWLTSDDDTYSGDDALERDILTSAFGGGTYISGSFEVLFPKPKFATGGLVGGISGPFSPGGYTGRTLPGSGPLGVPVISAETMNRLRDAMGVNIQGRGRG